MNQELDLYVPTGTSKKRFLLTLGHNGICLPMKGSALVTNAVIVEEEVITINQENKPQRSKLTFEERDIVIVGLSDGCRFDQPIKATMAYGQILAVVELD